MVINSAQMQNAGKEFMFFQGLSAKQESQMGKDSFSAIFNNATGKNSIFIREPINKPVVNNDGNNKDRFTNQPVNKDKAAVRNIFSEKADPTAKKTKAISVADDEEDTESFIEKAASFLFQITVTVTVVLKVSMDELKDTMQEMGLTGVDLLNPDKRYDVFVNLLAQGDAANLLKDNSLVDLLNTMERQIADIFTEDAVDAESFTKSLTQSMDKILGKTEELFEKMIVSTPVVSGNTADKEVKTSFEYEEVSVADGIENRKLPEVTVSTSSQNDSTGKNDTESSKKEKTEPIKAEDLSGRFVNHLVDSFESRFQQIKVTEVQAMPDLREIVNQIMDQVKIHINNANTSIEIQLTPESLGKVQVSVEDNNGVLTAKFQAENRVAKEAIESSLVQFKEHLAEQGIKVDSVEVSVGNFDLNGHQFGKGQGQEAESHVKKHFSMEDAGYNASQPEDLKEAAYIDNGTSTVSFKA